MEAGTSLPPNARIESLLFDDESKLLLVTLRGQQAQQRISASAVAALFGARIRHESLTVTPGSGGEISFGKVALTAATGIPVGFQKGGPKEKVTPGQELHYALAMRVDGLPELWYLLAASFNFRKPLGADATYAMEMNLRLFVRRLAGFVPHAVQDGFVGAMILGSPLPPPVDSLFEFFRAACARST